MTNRNIDNIPSELQAQFLSQLLEGDLPVDFWPDNGPDDWPEDELAIAGDADVTIDPTAALANDPMLDLRDSPMIEDRFQALLKEHFLAKAEENLPLFPWEGSEIQEYPDGVAETTVNPWLAQLETLRAQVPDNVFEQILGECQELVQGSLQVGRQMLDAVDSLFPGADQALNLYADRLIPSLEGIRDDGVRAALPAIDYEDAQDQQKMVLALVTAHELLRQLEVPLTQEHPVAERQWLTSEGLLEVRAEWRAVADAVVVTVQMPCGGQADLAGDHTNAEARCDQAGQLNLILPVIKADQMQTLSIRLDTNTTSTPLTFTIRVAG